jgi:hypothetical protein
LPLALTFKKAHLIAKTTGVDAAKISVSVSVDMA